MSERLPARDLPPVQPPPPPREIVASDEPFEPLPEHLTPELVAHMLQLTPAGVAVLDPRFRAVKVSAAACQLLEYSLEELMGQDYLRHFHPEEQAAIRSRWADPGQPQRYRYPTRIVRKDGQVRHVETMHFHAQLEGRNLVGVVLLDITEGRRLLHRLTTLTQFASLLAVSGSLRETLDGLATRLVATSDACACRFVLEPVSELVVDGLHVQVPVCFGATCRGAMHVTYVEGADLGDAELTFLRSLADLAGVAVENARLFEEAQEKAALEERQRLAWELHDSVSQALHGIALGAQTVRIQLERDPAAAVAPLDYVLGLCDGAHREMQALLLALRPEAVEKEGLVAALMTQAEALRARHGLQVEFEAGPEPAREHLHGLFRVASEALHNVVKHARARRVWLRLGPGELEVRDDGRGFDPSRGFPGHFGLSTMRERMERLGGSLSIESSPQGTRVLARVPA